MNNLICPECQSDNSIANLDDNSTKAICGVCGYKFTQKRVFISYGRDQYAHFAENLKNYLIKYNCDVWFDRDRIMEGGDWEQCIEDGLNWVAEAGDNGIFLFIVTPHSVRRPEGFCLKEMAKAISKRIMIVPVMVIYSELPLSICNIQWLDMQDCIPIEDRFDNFIKKSKQLLKIINSKQLQAESLQFTLSSILEPIDYSDDIIERTKKFTGREWLIEKFDHWLKNSTNKNRIFWVTGAPGVGKSSIAAWIAENRREIGAIHFCGFKNEEKNDPIRLIKSITYQLTTQLPEYSDLLMELDPNETIKTYNDATTLFNKMVVQTLRKVSPPDRNIVIVIDAIDEASKNGQNEVASFIANEFDKTPAWLKLFITSRPDPEVMLPLQKLSPITIDTSCCDNYHDIKRYLHVELLPFLNEVQMSIKDEIVNKLAEKSEGIFQYISCICEELAKGNLEIENVDSFPKSLGNIYLNFFERQFKDISYYQKNVKDIIAVIISAKQPIETILLRRIFNISDTDFFNLLVLMGSIFEVRGKADNETIKIQHLSYTDWLTDREKSGYYCVSNTDGLKRLVEFGLKEYEAYRSDSTYSLHTHIVKWLPSYLADLNNYRDFSILMNDKEYIKKKIALGFTDILFKDFRIQLGIAQIYNDSDSYHVILSNSILAHNLKVSIFIDTIKRLTKSGDYTSIKQAIETSKQLSDKELLISYFSILYSTLLINKLNQPQKIEIVNEILKRIHKNFPSQYTSINCLDFFPVNFINAICYQIEELDIQSTSILEICRFREVEYFDGFDWHNKVVDIESKGSYSMNTYHVLLTDLAFSFYFDNNINKSNEIINKIDDFYVNFFYREIEKVNDTKVNKANKANSPYNNTNSKKTNYKKKFSELGNTLITGIIIGFFTPIYLTLVIIYLIHVSMNFIAWKAFRMVYHIIKHYIKPDNVIYSHFNKILDKFFRVGKKIVFLIKGFNPNPKRIIRDFLRTPEDRAISACKALLEGYSPEKEEKMHKRIFRQIQDEDGLNTFRYTVSILKNNGLVNVVESLYKRIILENDKNTYQKETIFKTNSLQKKFIATLINESIFKEFTVDLLYNYNKSNDVIKKMLSLGDVAFVSLNPKSVMRVQKQIIMSVDNKKWVNEVLGKKKIWSYQATNDWSLINQTLVHGVLKDKQLDDSYNNLLFFIDNYEVIISKYPGFVFFPELAGGERIELLKTESIVEFSEELIKSIESKYYFKELKTNVSHFDLVEANAISLNQDKYYLGIIGLLHYSTHYSANNQPEKSELYFQKALSYIKDSSKNKVGLFEQLFNEIYINKNINRSCKLLLENTKDCNLDCDILLVNYLLTSKQSMLDIFLTELAEKTVKEKFVTSILWLIENGIIEVSETIIDKITNQELKDELLGHLAYNFLKDDNLAKVKQYLTAIRDKSIKDKWLQVASLLCAKMGDSSIVDYLIADIYYIDNKTLTLCLVAETYRVQNEVVKANKYLMASYNESLNLKKNTRVKKMVLIYLIEHKKSYPGISIKSINTLLNENYLKDNILLENIINIFIKAGDINQIERLWIDYPEFIREAGGIGTLYKLGYKFDENHRVKPVGRHYEIFRNLQTIENDLHEYTSQNIFNREALLDIAYRYAAYITFVCEGNIPHRVKVLEDLSKLIEIDDWHQKLQRSRKSKR